MKITLNGQTQEFSQTQNLGALAKRFCKDKNPVIAELNGQIIRNKKWENITLKDGDIIELVSFVGGGSVVAGYPLDTRNPHKQYNHVYCYKVKLTD